MIFIEAIEANREEYYTKYKFRDEEARDKNSQIVKQPMAENETYVIDVIRNNWGNGQSL